MRREARFLLHDSRETMFEGRRVLLFATNRSFADLTMSASWYGDGTFKCVPKVFAHLYSIHCERYGLIFPVFILLPSKKQAVYEHAFEACNAFS